VEQLSRCKLLKISITTHSPQEHDEDEKGDKVEDDHVVFLKPLLLHSVAEQLQSYIISASLSVNRV